MHRLVEVDKWGLNEKLQEDVRTPAERGKQGLIWGLEVEKLASSKAQFPHAHFHGYTVLHLFSL